MGGQDTISRWTGHHGLLGRVDMSQLGSNGAMWSAVHPPPGDTDRRACGACSICSAHTAHMRKQGTSWVIHREQGQGGVGHPSEG